MIHAYLDDFNIINIEVSKLFYDGKLNRLNLKTPTFKEQLQIVTITTHPTFINYECRFSHNLEFGKDYYIDCEYGRRTTLNYRNIVYKEEFDTVFATNEELGSFYSKDATTFKIWAPTAIKVFVKIKVYDEYIIKPLQRINNIYQVTVNGDYKNAYYTYLVYVNGKINETTDPYSIASTSNSNYSVIVDLDELNYPIDKSRLNVTNNSEAIIYELSVHDYTFSKTTNHENKGTFKALATPNTHTIDYLHDHKYSTGIDYIDELGITHIQLMPVNDFATIDDYFIDTYNWGYDPLQYFALQQTYSSEKNAHLLINEFKQMINEYNKRGIGVNVDVVFNHVYDTNLHSFDKIIPGYYFRKDSNGSFCGNDLATEKTMVRKYFVKVVDYLANFLQIDGIRFDLMGIIDIETMQEMIKVLPNRYFMMYGEGWNMPTELDDALKSTMDNYEQLPEVAFFNDRYRDILRGQNELDNKGIIFSEDYNDYLELVTGKLFFKDYYQSINYVECHDNYSLYDKLSHHLKDEKTIELYSKFATCLVLISNGISFIHSGQEFMRTKYCKDNTYNLGDEFNEVDWGLRIKHQDNIKYLKTVIQLKKEYQIGLLPYEITKLEHVVKLCTGVIAIYINPTTTVQNILLDSAVEVLLTSNTTDKFIETNNITIEPKSIYICRYI